MNSKEIFMVVAILATLSAVVVITPVLAQNMTGGNMTGGNMTGGNVTDGNATAAAADTAPDGEDEDEDEDEGGDDEEEEDENGGGNYHPNFFLCQQLKNNPYIVPQLLNLLLFAFNVSKCTGHRIFQKFWRLSIKETYLLSKATLYPPLVLYLAKVGTMV